MCTNEIRLILKIFIKRFNIIPVPIIIWGKLKIKRLHARKNSSYKERVTDSKNTAILLLDVKKKKEKEI